MYYHAAVKMTEDTEYGLAPSFDESGHSNQTFQTEADDTSLTLELHEDGSYVFSYSTATLLYDKFSDTRLESESAIHCRCIRPLFVTVVITAVFVHLVVRSG